MNKQTEETSFDIQMNNNPEIQQLQKQLGDELMQMSGTVAALSRKIHEVWPTMEGADGVPPLPLILYQIAETLRQDICVTAMDILEPGWEEKAKAAVDEVLGQLKNLAEGIEDSHKTIH